MNSSQTSNQTPSQAPYPNTSKLGSIKTELLVAFIFSLLVLILYIILLVSMVATVLAAAPRAPTSGYQATSTAGLISIVLIAVIFVVLIIPSILVVRRINRMRRAANRGDVASLKKLNSVGWAILALLFNGVIAGVLLLVANGAINDLQ